MSSPIYKLREHVNENNAFDDYYCANIVEKRFDCSNKLIYKKSGGYGRNYRYCSTCYDKWDELKREQYNLKCETKIIKVQVPSKVLKEGSPTMITKKIVKVIKPGTCLIDISKLE